MRGRKPDRASAGRKRSTGLGGGKRGRRDEEEREKGRGPAGREAARGGGGGIFRRTAVGRGAAQVLPARGGKGRKGKKIKEREKNERGEKNIPKNRDGKGIPSLFRDRKQIETEKKIPSLFLETEKKIPSLFRDGNFSVSI